MRKGIKKAIKVLAWLILTMVIGFLALVMVLQIPRIQTYVCNRLATYYATELKVKMHIGHVSMNFLNVLDLKDVYLEDQQMDTLFYAKRLSLVIKGIHPSTHEFNCGRLRFNEAKFKFHQHLLKGKPVWNYQFLVDYFTKPADSVLLKKLPATSNSASWKGKCRDFELANCSFAIDTLHLNHVSGTFSNLKWGKKNVEGNLHQFSFDLNNRFRLTQLSLDFNIEERALFFKNLEIETPKSHLFLSGSVTNIRWSKFSNWSREANFNFVFAPSVIGVDELAFVPWMNQLPHSDFHIEGTITGRASCFGMRKIRFQVGRDVLFQGNADVVGLTENNDPYLNLDIQKTVLYLADFPMVHWPTYLLKNSNLAHSGLVKGHYKNLQANGTVTTKFGNIKGDVHVSSVNNQDWCYKGNMQVVDFNLGGLLNEPKLGLVSFQQSIDGCGLDFQHLVLQLDGIFDKLEVNHFNYANTHLTLGIDKKMVEGNLNLAASQIKLITAFKIDFNGKEPATELFAGLTDVHLNALHLITSPSPLVLSTGLRLKLYGLDLNSMTGELAAENTVLRSDSQRLSFTKVACALERNGIESRLSLKSDFLDFDLSGKFDLLHFGSTFQGVIENVFPSQKGQIENVSSGKLVTLKKVDKPSKLEQIALKGQVKDLRLLNLFGLGKFEVNHPIDFSLNYDSELANATLKVSAQHTGMNGLSFKQVDLESDLQSGNLNWNLTLDGLSYHSSDVLQSVTIQSHSALDTTSILLSALNTGVPHINARAGFNIINKRNGDFTMNLENTFFQIADSVWVLNPKNRIMKDSLGLHFSDFSLRSNKEVISLDGHLGARSDSAVFKAENLALSQLNPFLKPFGIQLEGLLNMRNAYVGNLSQPQINSVVRIGNFKFNREELGDLSCNLHWDTHKAAVLVNGGCVKGNTKPIDFYGFYYPGKDSALDVSFALNDLSLEIFRPFVAPFCRNFDGHFGGMVKATGTLVRPLLNGGLNVVADKITINYLGTSYSCKGPLLVTPTAISCKNMVLHDQLYNQILQANLLSEKDKANGYNSATVNAVMSHDNFTKFKIDLTAIPNKLMVLNTAEGDNPLYYGQAFASGEFVRIAGYFDSDMFIDAKLKSDQTFIGNKYYKSKIVIPLSNPSELGANSFITFVNHDTLHAKKSNYKVNLSGVQLNLNLDVSNDLETLLMFDQKVGDVIKAKGTGALRMEVNTLGTFKIYGSYTFDNGDYLFTLQNVINKRFDIEKGSFIKWNGDPYDAEINMNAIYKLRTTLSPLFPGDSSGTYKRRYPVDCKMLLSNKLLTPDINFEVDLPSVNDGTRTDVRNMVNNELEINRQVFSLMVLGSFLTPQSLSGYGATYNGISGAAGLNASTELLSNQLSNLIGKLNSGMDVGVRYSPGSLGDKITNQELQVALSTQFLNNRLLVDGNVGTISSTTIQNTNAIVGDVNVEYKLTPDGKVKMKAFNKTNDNAIVYQTAPYTQGIGIFYREEFSTLDDLFKKYLSHWKRSK